MKSHEPLEHYLPQRNPAEAKTNGPGDTTEEVNEHIIQGYVAVKDSEDLSKWCEVIEGL